MSEKENNLQTQKPKTSKLAIASMLLALVPTVLISLVIVYSLLVRPIFLYRRFWVLVWILGPLMLSIFGLAIGIGAIGKISNSKGLLKGTGLAIAGIIIAAGMILFNSFLLIRFMYPTHQKKFYHFACAGNLSGLGRAMLIYANDFNDAFPTVEKWKVEEEEESGSGNFRRSSNDEELKYWLENMVWYHRFTNEEIRDATGLTENKIAGALKKFNIRPDNRPKRAVDTPLLVLPYPGGRHPRIGFLDGAIDPQRETKFSVFTPWDANSYVVVDVPEAIWSNLGLTYLAHTHIDTMWTKQGIELPKLEWNRKPDGALDIERKLPNGIAFGMQVKPTTKAVRMELWLKNGTDQKLSDLRVQNCVMTKMAAGFEQQTNDNKVLTNPYVACRSSDGRRWIITAWENCDRPWGNERCPCFHSDPKFPDLEPGQTYRLHGWLSFYEGTDIKAEFKRIEATGWLGK